MTRRIQNREVGALRNPSEERGWKEEEEEEEEDDDDDDEDEDEEENEEEAGRV